MKAIFAVMVLGFVVGNAIAQTLSDPMRPPNAAEAEGPGANAGPILQSILIAPNRSYAVIDGQQVRLGERFRGATLVGLTVSEATLKGASATTILKLYPEVRKAPGRPGGQLLPTGTEEGDVK